MLQTLCEMVGPVEKIQYGYKNSKKYINDRGIFEYKKLLQKVTSKKLTVTDIFIHVSLESSCTILEYKGC
jgi:hypothetical protein